MDEKSKKPTTSERRRSPRGRVPAAILVRVGDSSIEGTVENLSYAGVMVVSNSALPEVGQACDVLLKLPAGEVTARGKVARLEPELNQFAIDLEHVDTNGEILLATLLMAGGA